jgi:hypothetical protein
MALLNSRILRHLVGVMARPRGSARFVDVRPTSGLVAEMDDFKQ